MLFGVSWDDSRESSALICVLPLLLMLLAPAALVAQSNPKALESLSLEELLDIRVVVATKTQQPVNEVPAAISVIYDRDIANYGFRSVAEALTHIPGFIDLYDGNNHNFGVRGSHAGNRAASRIIKVMVNGTPIGFRSNQNHWLGLDFIPIEVVKRIEVIRGPVSALYGADALSGAVNVVTEAAHEHQLAALEYEAGGDNRHLLRTSLTGGFTLKQSDWVYSLQLADVDRTGLTIPVVSPDYKYLTKTTTPKTTSKPSSIFIRGQTELDKHQFAWQWLRQEKNLDHVFFSRNSTTGKPTHVNLINQTLNFNWEVALDSQNEIRSQFIYANGDTGSKDRVETGANDFFFDRQFGYSSITVNGEWLWTDVGDQQNLLIGLDWDLDKEKIESFTRVNVQTLSRFQFTPQQTKEFENRAFYVQWQAELSSNWRMILGARIDDHSIYDTQESYRLGFIQTINKNWQLKWLTGSSFQAPSPELLFRTAVEPGDVIGNPNLKPQRLTTTEVQLSGVVTDDWHANISLFYNEVKDLVTYQQEFFNRVARNAQDSIDQGVEIEIKRMGTDWSSFINLSYIDIQREENALTLVPLFQRESGELMPSFSASFGVSKRFFSDRFNISFINTFHDSRPASTENVLLANQDYSLDSFWTTDISAKWELSEFQQVQLKIRDLFDNKGVYPGFGGIDYPRDGRQLAITYWRAF